MIKHIVVITVFLVSCSDKPYQQHVEKEKATYKFSGTADLGTALSGATVTAYAFSGLQKGEKLAETISGREGDFELDFATDHDGPILLTTSGGVYRDLATNETLAIKPEQELRSVIAHIKMPERANVNAWTTLATARVLAKQGFWDKNVANLKDIDRINVDFSLFSYFLSGKNNRFINIKNQALLDIESDDFKPEDPRAMLHLANGGLSQLAKHINMQLSSEEVSITVPELLLALSDDQSDRVFDGRNAEGSVVYVGNSKRLNFDSSTMRKQLAEAMVGYLNHLEETGKIGKDLSKSLMSSGHIVESIAADTRPELFLERDRPLPIDREAPELQIAFAGEHAKDKPFAFLDGDVSFNIQAQDKTFVSQVKMLSPNLNRNNATSSITIDDFEDPVKVAEECGKKEAFLASLKDKTIKIENTLCVCFEARDLIGNTARELSCFQRRAVQSKIDSPVDRSVLRAERPSASTMAKANIKSGIALKECSWAIYDQPGFETIGPDLPKGDGIIAGGNCIIDDEIPVKKLPLGNYFFVVKAVDMKGREITRNSSGRNYARFRVGQ
jgi:hypothetical protein